MPVIDIPSYALSAIILGGCSLIPASIAIFITGLQFKRQRHFTSFLIFIWFTLSLVWNLFLTLSEVLFVIPMDNPIPLVETLFLTSIGLIVPIAFIAVCAADFLTKERIDQWHLFAITVIGTITSVLVFIPNQNYVIGAWIQQPILFEMSFNLTGLLIANFVLGLFYSFIFASLALKIYKSAPPSLRKSARLFMIGGIIATFGTTIVTFLGSGLYFPGSNQLCASIGTLLLALSLFREPRLFYLLPTKIMRLSVLDAHSGNIIFSHNWPESGIKIDESLFAGMVQGMSLFIRESLNRGEVKEIIVDNATLIIHRSPQYPIAFILLLSNPTKTARLALITFAESFQVRYEQLLKDKNLTRIDRFATATEIINECFSFVAN